MKKFLLTLLFGFIMTINFNAQTQELDNFDRVKIVETMNKYAIGIDTKDYELFRSIFLDDVEVRVIYDPNWKGGGEIKFNGKEDWVNYVQEAISQYRATQHMLGNPMISFDGEVAKVRTDLQASHYYIKDPEAKTTLWGFYETHMVKNENWKIIKHTLTSIGSE
tara:strand:- start:814 stop:1305 length:492 start_codon:yes stop_codon:yes gene_type:complete